MGILDGLDLPSLADRARERYATQKGATPSRLQAKAEKAKDEGKLERAWKAGIWKRDGGKCRWCHRKVAKTISLVPERGECHHISGRVVQAIRWDVRNGILVDAACHERLTGKVAEKFLIHSKHTFTVDGVSYINADKPVLFQRVA